VAKRAFDVVAALTGLIVLSPLSLVIAIAILIESGAPILYRGQRVGQGEREFRILKFRTMIRDADTKGGGITVAGDPRITPVGRWLRRTKLDEVPQLWNVLVGEMSFVGPRPEDPRFVSGYQPAQRRLLEVKPGITSPASIKYRNEEQLLVGPNSDAAYREILADKLRIDLEYVDHRSFWSDLGLIFRTLFP
jgi:lipopolysaccharide/colanic/teichoic acid biosynthesis glycosyltransferase